MTIITFWGERGSRSKAVILQLESSLFGGSQSSRSWILCWQVAWTKYYDPAPTFGAVQSHIGNKQSGYWILLHGPWYWLTPIRKHQHTFKHVFLWFTKQVHGSCTFSLHWECEYVHIPFSQMQFEFICKIQIRFVKAFLPVPVLGHKPTSLRILQTKAIAGFQGLDQAPQKGVGWTRYVTILQNRNLPTHMN